MSRVLWVGGTSALARTYFEEVHPARGVPHVIVAAPERPAWPLGDVPFVRLDLNSEASVRSLFSRLPHAVDAIVLGVRLSLVWARPEQHEALAKQVSLLIAEAAEHGCTSVLHISSIAVTDHVTAQHLVSEKDPVPPVEALSSPYDRFKLRCEHAIDETCAAHRARIKVWCQLRISGIFSNDRACLQCTAVRRQALLSHYSAAAIDFNSSRNVGHAIALLLERMHASVRMHAASATRPTGAKGALPGARDACSDFVGRQLFYYTRSTPDPAPYWHHVRDYRRAHGIFYGVFLPAGTAEAMIPSLRRLAQCIGTPLAQSLDYLMAVATLEHSADNTKFRTAFPAIEAAEETIHEAFVRMLLRRANERTPRSTLVWRAALVASLAAALYYLSLVVSSE